MKEKILDIKQIDLINSPVHCQRSPFAEEWPQVKVLPSIGINGNGMPVNGIPNPNEWVSVNEEDKKNG